MSDSTQLRAEGQGEQHAFQFRYFVVPAVLIELVANKTISRGEAWLLGLIDSLVKTRGEGCWASNAWLAEHSGISRRQVQYDIEHLRELGLVVDSTDPKVVNGEPRRTLETSWSRNIEWRTPVQSIAPPCNTLHTPCETDCTQVRLKEKNKLKSDASILIDGSKPKDDWSNRCAKRLYTFVTKTMGKVVSYKQSMWSREFTALRASLDGKEHVVDEIMTWLEKDWEKVWIKVYCAKSFKDKFTKLCEIKDSVVNKQGTAHSGSNNKQGVPSHRSMDISEEVHDQLKELPWPNGEPEGLVNFYLQTIEDAKRLVTISKELGDEGGVEYLLNTFVYKLGESPKKMAMRWCSWLATDMHAWKSWSGSFRNRELRPDSKRFLETLIYHTPGVVSSKSLYPKLIQVLNQLWSAASS